SRAAPRPGTSSRTPCRRTTALHRGQLTGSRSEPRDVPSLAPLVGDLTSRMTDPGATISRPGAVNVRIVRRRHNRGFAGSARASGAERHYLQGAPQLTLLPAPRSVSGLACV